MATCRPSQRLGDRHTFLLQAMNFLAWYLFSFPGRTLHCAFFLVLLIVLIIYILLVHIEQALVIDRQFIWPRIHPEKHYHVYLF